MKLGWVGGGKAGTLGEAAAAAEILKSSGRSGSQPHNFGTCASKLSGETRNSTSFEQVIISTQTGEISQVQLEGLGLKLRLSTSQFSFLCSGGRRRSFDKAVFPL